jgi:hypothetical protein
MTSMPMLFPEDSFLTSMLPLPVSGHLLGCHRLSSHERLAAQ